LWLIWGALALTAYLYPDGWAGRHIALISVALDVLAITHGKLSKVALAFRRLDNTDRRVWDLEGQVKALQDELSQLQELTASLEREIEELKAAAQ
jgi:hypothetical protein